METWRYLQPENVIAAALVLVLKLLFLAWCLLLASRSIALWRRKLEIGRAVSFPELSAVLKSQDRTDPGLTANAFDVLRGRSRLNPKSPISRHLRAIFEAGLCDGRLDVGDLIRHTAGQLFKLNALLRAVLSVFIVVGLLGTLFGLADSLANLSPVLVHSSAPGSQEQLSVALGSLLDSLKSAFAPSIWGISFTIIGVFLFGAYSYLGCAGLLSRLEQTTLTVWVPALFPTTQQRLLRSLELTEELGLRNIEHVRKVAELADQIQDKAGVLNNSLDAASATINSAASVIQSLSETSGRLAQFGTAFSAAVQRLTSFQNEIRALYAGMSAESAQFHENVSATIDKTDAFHSKVAGFLEKQGDDIKKTLATLQIHQTDYIRESEKAETALARLIETADMLLRGVDERNRELVGEIGKPLTESLSNRLDGVSSRLADGLDKVDDALRAGLLGLKERLDGFGSPIDSAANHLIQAHGEVVRTGAAIMREVQTEFARQNETSHEQLNSLNTIMPEIQRFVETLSDMKGSQENGVRGLSQSVTELSRCMGSLVEGVGSITHCFELSEEVAGRFKLLETQYSEITNRLSELSVRLDGHPISETAHEERLQQLSRLERQNNRILKAIERLQQQEQGLGDQFQKLLSKGVASTQRSTAHVVSTLGSSAGVTPAREDAATIPKSDKTSRDAGERSTERPEKSRTVATSQQQLRRGLRGVIHRLIGRILRG